MLFAGKRDDVRNIEDFCKKEGIACGMLIGGCNPKKPDAPFMTLEERRNVVCRFKSRKEDAVQVLIATDLDAHLRNFLDCSVVINFDFSRL